MAEIGQRPAFQSSETSRVSLSFYSHGDEVGLQAFTVTAESTEIVVRAGHPIPIAVETSKVMGAPMGQFVIDLKADEAGRAVVREYSDDDWVDIEFSRFGRPIFVMRGQIDHVELVTAATGDGTTEEVYRIYGADHGRPFAKSPVWFDLMSDGEHGAGVSSRVLEAAGSAGGDPASNVESIMAGFFREFQGVGRNLWELPPMMPYLRTDPNNDAIAPLVENIAFYDLDFLNYPGRYMVAPINLFPGHDTSVWNMAAQWADWPLCELYFDIMDNRGALISVPGAKFSAVPYDRRPELKFGLDNVGLVYPYPITAGEHGLVETPVMAAIFRDKPFLTGTRINPDGREQALDEGPWFNAVTNYVVYRREIASRQVVRSGDTRYNAFQATCRPFFSLQRKTVEFTRPLWNPTDIARHGLRRMDVEYDYFPSSENEGELFDLYRKRLRDFNCMNHLFYSGTITFAYGRPDMRIGHRLTVRDEADNEVESYYIEAVKNRWTLASGVRTTLGVTRGWLGTTPQLLETFERVVSNYEIPSEETGEGVPEADNVVTPDDDDWKKKAERYPPRSQKAVALFTQAALHPLSLADGIPTSWADPSDPEGYALHQILAHESQGYVGRPNFLYQPDRLARYSGWLEIHSELKSGIINSRRNRNSLMSSATGLGQLLLRNVQAFYPSGSAGINDALEEAVGMLRYIRSRHNTPVAAWAAWQANKGKGAEGAGY